MKNLIIFLFLFIASFLYGQELVKDINGSMPKGSNPRPLAYANDTLYFSTAFSAEISLWKMGVSSNEPILIKTFSPINFFRYIDNAIFFDGKLYFSLEDDEHGEELWVSDGTEMGTSLFKNIAPGNDSSLPSRFMAVGDYLYFLATNGDSAGSQLWVTDGTLANTFPVNTLANSNNSWQIISYNDGLIFTNGNGFLYKINAALEVSSVMPIPTQIFNLSSLEGADRFIFWTEGNTNIWINDGLDSMINFFNGNESTYESPAAHAYHEGSIVFIESLVLGVNIWKSDGTPGGNVLLKSFETESFGGVYSSDIDIINNDVYFYISWAGGGDLGGEIWKTDLTPAGTVHITSGIDYYSKIVSNDKLYFSKRNDSSYNENGDELWVFDGSEALPIYNATGNCEIASILRFLSADTTLFFINNEGSLSQPELWRLNIPSQEILMVEDLNPNIIVTGNLNLHNFTTLNDKMFFSTAEDFWVTDGVEEGTEIFFEQKVINHSHNIGDSILVYLLRDDCTGDYTLWKTDGTTEGVSILYHFLEENNEMLGSDVLSCFQFEEKTYLVTAGIYNYAGGYITYEILETDGTSEGTHILHFITVQDDYCSPVGITKFKNELYFTNGVSTLNKINPITGEDVEVIYMDSPFYFIIGKLRAVEDYLYFIDCLGDKQLWRTDGTTGNATKLASQNFWPAGLEALSAYGQIDDFFLFKGKDELGNYGIWGTNNTTEGTNLLAEIPPFDTWNALDVSELFELDGTYFFIVQREDENSQLWTTDGSTSAGTYVVKDLPGKFGTDVQKIRDRVFFTLYNEIYGVELWITNGTYLGTKMVFDLNEGEGSSTPKELTLLNDDVLFSASGMLGERDLWKFDMLTETIELLKATNNHFEIYPNPISESSEEIYIKFKLDKKTFADIKIYGIEGKLLGHIEKWLVPSIDNSIKLPANLAKGVYLLNLSIDNETTALKFTLQ